MLEMRLFLKEQPIARGRILESSAVKPNESKISFLFLVHGGNNNILSLREESRQRTAIAALLNKIRNSVTVTVCYR